MKRTTLFLLTFVVALIAVAMPHAGAVAATVHHAMTPDSLVFSVAGLALMGTLTQVSTDNDSFPARRTTTRQYNKLAAWQAYKNRNWLLSTTIATMPGVAIATTTTKVKTANATVVLLAGVATALGITDNAWTLTGGHLLTGFTRKYLLLWNGSTFTVQASDQDAANGSASTAWTFSNPSQPADGVVIVGIATVANGSGADFIPATTALSAAGITLTCMDGAGDDSVLPFGIVVPT